MEDEIRWRDWDWIYDRIEKVQRDRREARRWEMMCAFISTAAAQHGGESAKEWQEMFHSLYSEAEQLAAQQAEQEAQEQEQAEARKKAIEEYMAQMAGGNGGSQFLTKGGAS